MWVVQSSVKALYDYTAHYFEQHGVENAARKWEDIKAQMEDAVGLLDSLQRKEMFMVFLG